MSKEHRILRQEDANTCLACSLLFVVGKMKGQIFSVEDERRLYLNSFGRHRESFALSYLVTIQEYFPDLIVTLTVDSKSYRDYLRDLSKKAIQIEARPITIELVRNESVGGSLIVLVDRYFFDYEIHIPHYIVVEKGEGDKFRVDDPWSGKTLSMTSTQLQEAIFGVRYILWWSPMIIQLHQR